MTDQSVRADAVIDREGPVYVLDANDRVRRVTHAQKQDDGKVLVVYAGKSWDEMSPDVHLFLASPGQIQAHEDERDRLRVADALRALGDRIVRDRLPVPVSLARVTVGFDLDDEQDLSPWAKALGRDPVRPDFPFDPVIESTEFGVTVQLLGGRSPAEAALDAADAAAAARADNEFTVEEVFGPMYTGGGEDPRGLLGEKPKPAPDGWPVSDGHRPKVSDDAMQHDGRYDNGGAEA